MAVSLSSPIGLIAGNGSLPLEFAVCAREQGLDVVAVAHQGETDPLLESLVKEISWVKVGQLGKVIKNLRRAGVRQAAFAGGINRVRLFGGMRLDWRGFLFLARLRNRKDDSVLRAVAAEVERSGIVVFGAETLLKKSVPSAGVLTRRGLTSAELRDAQVAWEAARTIGSLDIGQSAVACDGLITAVEAVEGTDAALRRAAQLSMGAGGVVVKLSKPQQDTRFDLPTIGPNTIETMREGRLTALVLEASRSLILDPVMVVEAADRAGIAIVAAKSVEQLCAE